jgi:hypothetical protein
MIEVQEDIEAHEEGVREIRRKGQEGGIRKVRKGGMGRRYKDRSSGEGIRI